MLEEKEEERGRLDLRRLADQHWADIDVSNDQSSSTFDDLTRDWPYLAVCCLAWIRVVPMYMYKGPGGLMDCLIQVFPDELHMATLDTFLNTCTQLQGGVNVKNIFVALMDRLAMFAVNNPKGLEGIKAFSTFTQYISKVIQQQANLSSASVQTQCFHLWCHKMLNR